MEIVLCPLPAPTKLSSSSWTFSSLNTRKTFFFSCLEEKNSTPKKNRDDFWNEVVFVPSIRHSYSGSKRSFPFTKVHRSLTLLKPTVRDTAHKQSTTKNGNSLISIVVKKDFLSFLASPCVSLSLADKKMVLVTSASVSFLSYMHVLYLWIFWPFNKSSSVTFGSDVEYGRHKSPFFLSLSASGFI